MLADRMELLQKKVQLYELPACMPSLSVNFAEHGEEALMLQSGKMITTRGMHSRDGRRQSEPDKNVMVLL